MKSLVCVLILLCLFGAATAWQEHWLGLVRGEASRSDSPDAAAAHREPSGWDTVLIGGANEALETVSDPAIEERSAETHAPAPPTASTASSTESRSTEPATSTVPVVTRVVVQRGQSVSSLCQQHYGSARSELVEAVARYNRLQSADSIREGQELLFPTVEQLVLPASSKAH